MPSHRKLRIGIAFAATFGVSVAALMAFGGFDTRTAATYVYVAPKATGDGIDVADATSVGIDTSRIRDLVRPFLDGQRGRTTSLLVMKDGRLIIEEYFSGWKPDRRHPVQSISKSITSLLVGYAIQQHFIGSVDDPIAKYLPRHRHLLTGGKEALTIRHLLTMTAGIDWDEESQPYGDSANTRTQQMNSADGVGFVLRRPLVARPGETWTYNGGLTTVAGEVLRNASGLTPDQLVARAFAGMLDEDEIEPTLEAAGRWNAAGGFQVTPRGMAKIGQMLLQGGVWNGKVVFDREWITASTNAIGRGPFGYGYSWWRRAFRVGDRLVESVEGSGYGGQQIWMIPSLQLVITVTAENYEHPTHPDSIVTGGVFRALAPLRVTTGHRIDATLVDSGLAYPSKHVGWKQIVHDSIPDLGEIRSAIDTVAPRRLADGSWLVWWRVTTSKPRHGVGRPYDRVITRSIIRCETPTDARFKRVSTTGFLGDGPVVFQDIVGVDEANALPWTPAMGRREVDALQRGCASVSPRR